MTDGSGRRPAPDLNYPRRVHILGIGGSGMSAIAEVLVSGGHQVSGCDGRASATLDRLAATGVGVDVGHSPGHLDGADLVAVSTAIPRDNPEVAAAEAAGLVVWARSAVLGAICGLRRTAAVTGTHGKTTTSAFLAAALSGAGMEPSWIVGSTIPGLGSGARWAPGEWLVVEADESDGTMLALPRDLGLVTSVEPDHLDHYGGMEALVDGFREFLEGCTGASLVCADDPEAAEVGRAVGARTYGSTPGADYRIDELRTERAASTFTLVVDGVAAGEVRVPMPGAHNARNAAGALAAALEAGAELEAAAGGLSSLTGVARRFEWRGSRDGIDFVDDYAHLPGEVAAALEAASDGGWERVVCAFQPHRYSRTEALWADLGPALDGADVVFVSDVYPAGEASRPGVTGLLVADAARASRPDRPVGYAADLDALVPALATELRPGDLCLTLGAGDLTTVPDRLLDRVEVAASVLGDRARRDVALAPFTTYRVGGPAALFLEATSPADLALAARAVEASGVPVLVVGRGSNLLVADRGFAGLALTLGEHFAGIDVEGSTVRAGAAATLPVLARRTAAAGLTGLEWAVGVPGSVGGGVRMNAGGHGSDVATTLTRAWVWDLRAAATEPVAVGAAGLALGYRHSSVAGGQVVVEAEFELAPGDRAAAEARIAEIVTWRREHQPGGANAGSVFANPPGDSAGRLIDEAGARGRRRGSAFVSPKHANFFQVDPGGSADDVAALMTEVRALVEERLGVLLEPEVQLVGFSDEVRSALSSRASAGGGSP